MRTYAHRCYSEAFQPAQASALINAGLCAAALRAHGTHADPLALDSNDDIYAWLDTVAMSIGDAPAVAGLEDWDFPASESGATSCPVLSQLLAQNPNPDPKFCP